MNLILIDYENVQPSNLDLLDPSQYFIMLCLGAKQKSLPTQLVKSLIKFGQHCQIVECPKTGKNALDFVIVDEMARITTKHQFHSLYIISKDKGFDAIISYYLILNRVQVAKRLDSHTLLFENQLIEDNSVDSILTQSLQSNDETTSLTEREIAILKVQKEIDRLQKISLRTLPKKTETKLNWIKNILQDPTLSLDEIKSISEQVKFPSTETNFQLYIEQARKKLNSLDKHQRPNKPKSKMNWVINFFNGKPLTETQLKQIRQKIFK